MEILPIGHPDAVKKAASVLSAGGIVIYPTDTLYGLGADATDREAIERVYELKSRVKRKPIHVVVKDLEAAGEYVEITPLARKLAKAFLPGALTIVLKAKKAVPPVLLGEGETLGIRVPAKDFCLELAGAFGRPYTTTSANRSGSGNPLSMDDLREMLDENLEHVDLIIDGGQLPRRSPSTLVDATGALPKILREGAISEKRILSLCRQPA